MCRLESSTTIVGSNGAKLHDVKRSRPGSLPVFVGREYSEVTPYHAPSADSTLPRSKRQDGERIQNQLYQMVDYMHPEGCGDELDDDERAI